MSGGSRLAGKSVLGIPDPLFPKGVVLADEARKSRRRLYPVSFLYLAYALPVITLGLRSHAPRMAAAFMLMGLLAWTHLEYLVHRYVLHGRFPAGLCAVRNALHRLFDHLHYEHHQRPWDGNHINGTLKDTGVFVAIFVALSWLAPLYTWPVFVAGLLVGYVAEEWIHHSCHFYSFKGRFFRHLKSRHHYHHSRHGSDSIFGLSNGMWDAVFGTTMDAAERSRRQRHTPPHQALLASAANQGTDART
jgi:sterol desaturase/sphingolipid hydroxylase (fatty acid hydroxylase superfamily)